MVFTVRNALGRSKSMVFTARIAHRTPKIAPGGPRAGLGRFGGLRGCSRDAPGGARRALATLPARLGTPPDAPGTPRSDQKVSPGIPNRFLGAFFSDSRSRDAPGTIFGRFWVPRGRSGRRFCCALPVFCEGRAFFVETPARPQKRTKKARKWSPDRPRSLPKVVPDPPRATWRAPFRAGPAIFLGGGASAGGAQRRGSDSEAQLSV